MQTFVVIARFCEAAVAGLSVDGAALTIVGSTGGRVFVHSTDTMSFDLDELQFGLAEGPCIDAVATRAPVFADELGEAFALGRWPAFARAATTLGVGAEYTFPLLIAGASFAVLQTYRREPGPLRSTQVEASEALLASFTGQILDELSEHLFSVDGLAPEVHDRIEVHQAAGMVSVQLGLAVQDALARLRAEAFADAVPLAVLAHDVIDRRRHFDPDQ